MMPTPSTVMESTANVTCLMYSTDIFDSFCPTPLSHTAISRTPYANPLFDVSFNHYPRCSSLARQQPSNCFPPPFLDLGQVINGANSQITLGQTTGSLNVLWSHPLSLYMPILSTTYTRLIDGDLYPNASPFHHQSSSGISAVVALTYGPLASVIPSYALENMK
jgi:hypothetical protein